MLTRDEATRALCEIMGLAFHAKGKYDRPSDGVCSKCQKVQLPDVFWNDGHVIDYIRRAVLDALSFDGISHERIRAAGFDPHTGRELSTEAVKP